MPPRTPVVKSSPSFEKKPIAREGTNYKRFKPSWQLNCFDINCKWGISCFDTIKFQWSTELVQDLLDKSHNDLYTILDHLAGKELASHNTFFSKLITCRDQHIDFTTLKHLSNNIIRNFFLHEIFPKLKCFETCTWEEIEREKTGKLGRSKHHYIKKEDLSPDAQQRLSELKMDDIDEVFSLRLDGTKRLIGIRELNYFKILWIDLNHEVCISHLKGT